MLTFFDPQYAPLCRLHVRPAFGRLSPNRDIQNLHYRYWDNHIEASKMIHASTLRQPLMMMIDDYDGDGDDDEIKLIKWMGFMRLMK